MEVKERERIRVLEIVNKFGGYGGTERTLFLMMKYLDRFRFEPRVYSRDGLGGDNTDVFDDIGVPFEYEASLEDVLRSFRPHICHIHRAGWEEPEPIELAKACGVPIIIETNVFGRPDQSTSAAHIDCHLFVSYFCMRRYEGWVERPLVSDAYKVLYNPIDLDVFDTFRFDRDYSNPTVGRYSRPDKRKWHPICVEMVPHLLELVPSAKYLVAGETPEVRNRVSELGVECAVDYLPLTHDREEILGYLNRFHVFAHGAEIGESFGITIAEAMASGLPVVTHPSLGGRDNAQVELVDHGVTGFVTDNPRDYAQAVAFLLNNPDEAQKMGERGRAKVRAYFDARKIAAGLEEIFTYFYDKKVVRT